VLEELDLVVAAVHSRFKQSREEMTARICRALANPHVDVLAHPTGRLIGQREPYAVDLEEVLATAKRFGKAMEINSYPERLDLNDVGARRAHELGVPVAINTDTHLLDHLGLMELGVGAARRAWIARAEVVNAWPLERLLAWTRSRREAAGGTPGGAARRSRRRRARGSARKRAR
jgi:DNA polymerase (family 10)